MAASSSHKNLCLLVMDSSLAKRASGGRMAANSDQQAAICKNGINIAASTSHQNLCWLFIESSPAKLAASGPMTAHPTTPYPIRQVACHTRGCHHATYDMAVLIKHTLQLDPDLNPVGRAYGNRVVASQKLFQSQAG